MTAKLIKGPEVAAAIREQIAAELVTLKEKTGKVPGLAVILVGKTLLPKRMWAIRKKQARR